MSTTHGTMNYAIALKMVVSDGVKISRMHWQSEGWLKPRGHDEDSRRWVGCISGRDVGIRNDFAYWSHSLGDGGVVLYLAAQTIRADGNRSMGSISLGWCPSIEDTLASDWYIYTP